MKILINIKVKIIVDIKWLYKPHQLHQLLNLERLAYFEHLVQPL